MRSILLLVGLLSVLPLFAQESSARMQELEVKRRNLLEVIEATGDKLSETKQTGLQLLSTLTGLTAQVTARKKFIQTIDNEIRAMEKEERQMTVQINQLEGDLKQKQVAYANAIRKMYSKSSHNEKLLFLLSSENLSQAYRRMRYLREYTSWRRMQAEDITMRRKEVEAKREELRRSKAEKEVVMGERKKESVKLAAAEMKQKELVGQIKKQEKSLQAELNRQQRQAKEIDRQIERIIEEEARARRAEQNRILAEQRKGKGTKEPGEKQQSVAEAKPAVKGGYAMTRTELSLSNDFSKNRGRLPVPISGGRCTLVGRFGQRKHDQLKYVTTQNGGVDLQTTPGAEACAVFDGVVSKMVAIPGANKFVIVRHGNYLTVYSNLTDVYVKAGDRVNTKQPLGKIYSDPMLNNRTVLQFQLWRETTKLDPEPWLNL